ncbi:hypothetical protein IMSAGC020_02755 [Lachnospiraceae bacterium]|nr:hypothetical protein IMSAGC020_02755 [Lachnospiraceae bacterium]
MYLEDSLHPGKGLLRLGDPCADGLGAVYAGASPETDDGVTVVGMVQFKRFCDISCCGIGHSLVIDTVGQTALCKNLLKTSGQPKLHNPGVGDDQDVAAFVFPENIRKCFDAADDIRFPVREKRQGCLQSQLKCTAVEFLCFVHDRGSSFLAEFSSPSQKLSRLSEIRCSTR